MSEKTDAVEKIDIAFYYYITWIRNITVFMVFMSGGLTLGYLVVLICSDNQTKAVMVNELMNMLFYFIDFEEIG